MIWKVVDSRISQRQMGILWNLILSKNLAIARTPFFQWSQNYSQKFANMLLWTSSPLNHPFPMFEWLKRWSVADTIHRKWSYPVAGSRKPSSADIKEEEEREEESEQDKIEPWELKWCWGKFQIRISIAGWSQPWWVAAAIFLLQKCSNSKKATPCHFFWECWVDSVEVVWEFGRIASFQKMQWDSFVVK